MCNVQCKNTNPSLGIGGTYAFKTFSRTLKICRYPIDITKQQFGFR